MASALMTSCKASSAVHARRVPSRATRPRTPASLVAGRVDQSVGELQHRTGQERDGQ